MARWAARRVARYSFTASVPSSRWVHPSVAGVQAALSAATVRQPTARSLAATCGVMAERQEQRVAPRLAAGQRVDQRVGVEREADGRLACDPPFSRPRMA